MDIPFANDTITLFNKYYIKDEYGKLQTRWTSYVFKNSLFRKSKRTFFSENAKFDKDTFVAQAPKNKDYLDDFEWSKITDENIINSKFTVQNGDVIVKGKFDIDIPENSNPLNEIKKIVNTNSIIFTSKVSQVNTSDLIGLSHYCWEG